MSTDIRVFSLNMNIYEPLTEDEIQDQTDKINDDKTRVDVEKELESIIADVKTELTCETYSIPIMTRYQLKVPRRDR